MTGQGRNFDWDTVPCGLLTLDRDGDVRTLNVPLRRLLCLEPADPSPLRLEAMLTPASQLFVETTVLPTLLLVGAVDETYLTLRPSAGSDVPVLVNARVRADGDGTDWVVVRVEQRSRWETELVQAKRDAEARRREKEIQATELQVTAERLSSTLAELKESHWLLNKVATLLPTCMYCERVRGQGDEWQSAMSYLRSNSTFLTHGCCPACRGQMLRDFGLDE